jgi:hypothetical protein
VIAASIRRRLRNLETNFAELMPEYPRLSSGELAEMERQLWGGGTLTRVQLHRIEKQSPIIDGEHLISCHGGQVSGKRYIGVNMADV